MDFFEAEHRAKRRTHWLAVLFMLAVSGTVLLVYTAAWIARQHFIGPSLQIVPGGFWDVNLFWNVALTTISVILIGSAYKTWQLRSSASSIAIGLGGRPIDPNTRDPHERRLLNVVEEMAIASGTPVPAVHVLPAEPGINAFAMGLRPSDSGIAVTDGCLKLLTRDEMQGVVAHEFSHLLNGDSRLNVRLMGLVHGILVIGLIGSAILRSIGSSRNSASRRKVNIGGISAVLFAGAALYVIGSVGVFFARLIKAAVSRQRELLADASGVQFTRNPEGLAGALKKIGGLDQGSKLVAPRAEEASHFFFAEGIGRWTQWMSTHPPLVERIRELDPQFRGELPSIGLEPVAVEQELPYAALASAAKAHAVPARPRDVLATIGKLDDQHIAYAQSLLARLPQRVRESVREPWVARALVLALLLDRRSETRALQLKAVLALGDAQLADQVARAATVLDTCPLETRLPILDLSLPALRRLSPAQSEQLRAAVDALAQADSRLSLFEYTLECVLRRHLGVEFATAPRIGSAAEVSFDQALSLVLSMLVHSGAVDPGSAARAFSAACLTLSANRPRPRLLSRQECSLGGLEGALSRLGATAPRLRGEILAACVAAVASDGKVTVAEGELLRAISESLGCPMPPLLPGQQVAAHPDAAAEVSRLASGVSR
jgi:Zn-dependent protease with chaperone function